VLLAPQIACGGLKSESNLC